MQTSMYRQLTLEQEILENISMMLKKTKRFLYKHHWVLRYF
jgi:hypothetical protein